MTGFSPDSVPSWRETEQRAADGRAARRERTLDLLAGSVVVLLLVLLAVAVYRIGGGWS